MSAIRRVNSRVFLAAVMAGLLGESLLILEAQSRALEAAVRGDFRVVAALEAGVDEERRGVVEERLLALPGTETVDYVSPARVVERLAERDPGFPQAVALIGENPVPGFFEARLAAGQVAQAAEWVKAAEAIGELAEVSYSAPAARAVVELQFYARWARLVLGAAACLAGAAAAAWLWGAWRSGTLAEGARRSAGAALAAAGGWCAGALAAAAAARPAAAWNPAWPEPAVQAGALALCTLFILAWRAASEPAAGPASRGRERRAAAVALTLFAAAWALPGRAAEPAAKHKRELQALTRELEKAKGEAERFRAEAGKAERELGQTRRKQGRLESRIASLRRQSDEADGTRRSLGGRLATLDLARAEVRRRLARELSDYSRRETLLASAGTVGVLEDAVRRGAVHAKTAYLGGVSAEHRRTATEHAAAERRRAALSRKTRSELSELERARKSGAKARETFAETTRRMGEAEARIRGLEESRRALTSLVRELEKREPKSAQAAYRADPPVKARSLPWPLAGKVVSRFGKRRVPELGTWTVHNGVEIAAPAAGAVVRPVLPGEIIFSGPFRSYGNVVIVNHGGGFYSIYGHLQGPLQAKGTRVRPEAVLGKAAGNKVYLELRQAGRALDPLRWLKP
ncbi:MAG: peptidoglycan DD-metalloendopeptidase family protein [Elusimicrobia bacterium]|nr:peptidoglycan DD-metalloendopeptidase family protein [Elusimicrobiota bacterium]